MHTSLVVGLATKFFFWSIRIYTPTVFVVNLFLFFFFPLDRNIFLKFMFIRRLKILMMRILL